MLIRINPERWIPILIFSLVSFGCSSAPGPTPYHFSGFLTSYSGFRPAPDGSQAWSYRKPGLDLKPYTSVMIDPLVIWRSPESTYRGLDSGDMWQLRVTFHEKMVKALEGGYTIVQQPGPGVIRLRAALTDVVSGDPDVDSPGPLVPMTNDLLTGTTELLSFSNLVIGEAAIEAELLDGHTNERLAGYIEKRQSQKTYVSQNRTSTAPIAEIMDYWARKLRQRLDEEKGLRTYQKEIQ